jgi:hypothetical protein
MKRNQAAQRDDPDPKLIVWLAEFDPCVFESGFELVSVHRTKVGAEQALEKHRRRYQKKTAPQDWQQWRVRDVTAD